MSNAIYKKDLHDVALAVAQGSKDYTDKTKEEIYWHIGDYSISTQSDNTTASTKTVPTGATRCKIKKIYGLTEKFNPSVAYDNASTMTKTMPNVVYDFDVSKVEGASEVSENLIVLQDKASTTASGVTYTIKDGVLTLNGTATNYGQLLNITLNSVDGYFKMFIDGTSTGSSGYSVTHSGGTAYNANGYYTGITSIKYWFNNGDTFTNKTYKPMLVKGSTAPTEFKVGFDGIHNLELSGLKVEGANIHSGVSTYNDVMNNTIAKTIDLGNLEKGTYTISFNLTENSGNRTFVIYYSNNGVIDTNNPIYTNIYGTGSDKTHTFTLDESITYDDIRLGINSGSNNYTIKLDSLMINYGSVAKPYQPYIAPTTLPIDLSSILYNGSPLFEGNSLKGVNDVKDILTPYKATKKLGYIDLGSLNYITSSLPNTYYTDDLQSIIKRVSNNDEVANILCALYTTTSRNNITTNMTMSVNANGSVHFHNDSYATAEAFKTAMSGVYLVYELATPIEVSIDWSAILRNIQGYSNGTITLQNTYNMDTANTITYNSIIKENCCAKIVQSRGGSVIKTINLPTTASDGYSAGSVNNVRDFTTKKRYTNVSKESNLRTLDWNKGAVGDNWVFYSNNLNSLIKAVASSNVPNLLTTNYKTTNYKMWSDFEDKTVSENPNNNALNIIDLSHTDTTTFKTAMTNEPLYYELADDSKTESDITAIDNIIEVQPNDVLSFYDSNDNLVAVPSDLTYRIEVERV